MHDVILQWFHLLNNSNKPEDFLVPLFFFSLALVNYKEKI